MSWWRWMVSDTNKFVLIRSEGRVSVGKQLVLRTASTYKLLMKAPSWSHWGWLLKWWGCTATTRCSVIVGMQIVRLSVSHIVVYQGCATFITEEPNAIKQIRPRAASSFHTGCLVLVTGIKIHFVVLYCIWPAGCRLHTPVVYYSWCKYGNYVQGRTQGGGDLGLNLPSWICYVTKTSLLMQRSLCMLSYIFCLFNVDLNQKPQNDFAWKFQGAL